jgi:transposase
MILPSTKLDSLSRLAVPLLLNTLIHDIEAVTAAVILPWSNGQVEGQIHRLKLVKRQMYGRANFNLLRRRVLPYVPATVALSPKHTP